MMMLPLLTSLIAVNLIQGKTLLVETENKTVRYIEIYKIAVVVYKINK